MIVVAVSALYYAVVAHGVLATLTLAIPTSSGVSVQLVALAWALAETFVIALPFLALAFIAWSWPSLLPRDIWLAPLAFVVLPAALSGLWNLWALGTLRSDFAIGGELIPELTLAVDLLAALLGSALVILVQSRAGQPPRLAPAHTNGRSLHRQG